MITTLTELRDNFWESHPEFQSERRSRKRQNDYNATIRSCWVFFVDMMAKDGQISEKLARRAIL